MVEGILPLQRLLSVVAIVLGVKTGGDLEPTNIALWYTARLGQAPVMS